MAQVIVGVDVGSHAVRASRLRVGFKNVEIEKTLFKRLDDDPWPAVVEIVKGADQVIAAMHGDQISIRELPFAKAAARRLDQEALAHQLDGKIPFDVESIVLNHRVVEQMGDEVRFLIVAALRERVESFLAKLNELGINPREIAPGPLTLTELARRAYPEETVAVVDVGHQRTNITIAERGTFCRTRTFSFGGADVTSGLVKTFMVSEETANEWKTSARYLVVGDLDELSGEQRRAAEAVRNAVDCIVREIRQTLAAHTMSGKPPVTRLVLCGGGSRLRGLEEYLRHALDVPIEEFRAPETIGNAAEHDLIGGAMSLGLALQGTLPRGDRINLRQGDLAFEGEANAGRGLLVYAVAVVLLIMLTWGFSSCARHTSLERQRDAQLVELEATSKRLLGQQIKSFSKLQSLISQAAEKQGSSSTIPERDAFDVVEQISTRIPQSINHEVDVLDIRSGRVQLKGRVDKRTDADEIQKALSSWSECFVKVPVPQTTPAIRDKRLQYTMDIETRCP